MALPIRGEPADCVIHVRVTRTEYCAIVRLARANSLTISGLVGEAIAELAGDLGEQAPIQRTCCIGSLCASHGRCITHPAPPAQT